jgi:imidazolonepropionase
VDHLEIMTLKISKLKNDDACLPCFFLYSIYPSPQNDCSWTSTIATDYNPGSTPSGNMNFVVATAIKMKMTPEEAIPCHQWRRTQWVFQTLMEV